MDDALTSLEPLCQDTTRTGDKEGPITHSILLDCHHNELRLLHSTGLSVFHAHRNFLGLLGVAQVCYRATAR